MEYLYTFIISFVFIFLSELGDKTQILVLSFSAKNKTSKILMGVWGLFLVMALPFYLEVDLVL